jgi:hypothetical protein
MHYFVLMTLNPSIDTFVIALGRHDLGAIFSDFHLCNVGIHFKSNS